MTNFPEGWINKIDNGSHRFVNIVPIEGKEPLIKYFDDKDIYLPSEHERYEKEVLKRGENVIWLGVTGWTKPPNHYPEKYGTSSEEGIYETLVTALLIESVYALKKEGIDVDLRHGASDAGVDASAIETIERLLIDGSGVNCPKFMPWVSDNKRGGPVLVGKDKENYHELFSKYHQLLIVTGGREAAFYHDYLNRLKGDGCSVVADVMQVVSRNIIKAMDQMPGQETPQLNNAAAYVREKNSFTYSPVPRTFDELIAVTKLTLLDNAYKMLKREPNMYLLRKLEKKVIDLREKSYVQPKKIITKSELEERIEKKERKYKSYFKIL